MRQHVCLLLQVELQISERSRVWIDWDCEGLESIPNRSGWDEETG